MLKLVLLCSFQLLPPLYKCQQFHCDGAWGTAPTMEDHVSSDKHLAAFFRARSSDDKGGKWTSQEIREGERQKDAGPAATELKRQQSIFGGFFGLNE